MNALPKLLSTVVLSGVLALGLVEGSAAASANGQAGKAHGQLMKDKNGRGKAKVEDHGGGQYSVFSLDDAYLGEIRKYESRGKIYYVYYDENGKVTGHSYYSK